MMVYPETVTHPSINRARRRITTLIETNALLGSKPGHHLHIKLIILIVLSIYTRKSTVS